MTARQAPLLDLPAKRRVVRMHARDAGLAENGGHIVHFACDRCGYDAGWCRVDSVTEGKRGAPCPTCNPSSAEKSDA